MHEGRGFACRYSVISLSRMVAAATGSGWGQGRVVHAHCTYLAQRVGVHKLAGLACRCGQHKHDTVSTETPFTADTAVAGERLHVQAKHEVPFLSGLNALSGHLVPAGAHTNSPRR